MTRSLCLLTLTVAALLSSASTVLAAPTPRLKPTEVEAIAHRAAQPYVDTMPNHPFLPLAVERLQLGHIGKRLVWLAHMHATQFFFPCARMGSYTYCVPSFLPDPYALVTIEDVTGRVLGIRAEGSIGLPRCASGQVSTTAKPCAAT